VAYAQEERPRNNSTPFSVAIVVRDLMGGGVEVVVGRPGVPSHTDPGSYMLARDVVAGGKLAFESSIKHSPADTNVFTDVYRFAPPPLARFAFNRADYAVAEDGTVPPSQSIEVRRTGYLTGTPATVKLTTSNGTATAGADYVPRSETLAFAPGETSKTVTVQIVNDQVPESSETLSLTLSDPTGDSMLGNQSSATLTIGDDDTQTVQFSSVGTSVVESEGSVLVTVTRTGATALATSVDYATADGTASQRTDYIAAYGRLTFAPGETTKSFRVFIINDSFVEPDDKFIITLSNLRGTNATLGSPATFEVRILSDDISSQAPNPIDESQSFVRQHYLDFLNREPDPAGFQFWTNEIESCGQNAQCREVKRIHVSAAFFLSIEFQETGFLAYLSNKVAFGTRPTYVQFLREVQALQKDFVFGQAGAPAVLEANKRAYFDEFVARPAFVAKFGAMSNGDYVDALLAEGRLAPSVGNIFLAQLRGASPTQTGLFILRRDPNATSPVVNVSLQLSGLSSPVTAVHIHGPVTSGAAAAPILHVLPAGEFADYRLTLLNEQINFLNGGLLSVDVHTQNNPGGEISAQIPPARFRRDVLVGALDNQMLTRAQVLRIVAESEELRRDEFNRAFVLMQYFGYLRRDPDQDGYDFWLNKLNSFNGDFIRAEMVKAFISSSEYRQRFGPQ
jgi:hypothetical protein